MIKKNAVIIILWFILTLVIALVGTLLILFNFISASSNDTLILVSSILSFLILGFLSGNINQKKGLMSGIIISLVVIVIFALINFLGFDGNFSLSLLTKYLIMVTSGGLGGIIGVNFKPVAK